MDSSTGDSLPSSSSSSEISNINALPALRIGWFSCAVPTVVGGCWREDPQKLLQLWLDHIERQPILGRYRVEMLEAPMSVTPSGNVTQLRARVAELMSHPSGPPQFLVLPLGNTVWADSIMPELEAARIVTLAISPLTSQYICGPQNWKTQSGCRAPNTRRFRFAGSILNSGVNYFASFLGMLRISNVRSVGVIQTRSAFYDEVVQGITSNAAQFGIDYSFFRLIETVGGSIARWDQRVVDGVIRELANMPKEESPDVIFLVTYTCIPWIQAMRAANYLPKGLAAIRCVDDDHTREVMGDSLSWVAGPGQWSESMRTLDYTENADSQPWSMFPAIVNGSSEGLKSSPLQFAEAYRRIYNYSSRASPSYGDAAFLACFVALEAAITLANSSSMVRVADALNTLYQPSFFGQISFNRFGINELKEYVMFQSDSQGELKIIDPFVAAEAAFTYPMPHWDERVYVARFFAHTVERVFLALMLACVVCTVALCTYLWRHRKIAVLSAAGLPFYLTMGVGCLLAYGSILTWPVDNNSATCQARHWVWTGAFYFMVGPILANSWRIARIQSLVATFQKTTFTQNQTLLLTAGIMVPQLVLNVIWSGAGGMDTLVHTPDPLRPVTGFTGCVIPNAVGKGCMYVSISLLFLCLAVVCVLAWRIRGVGSLFNDARPLGASMYLFTLLALIVVACHVSLEKATRANQSVLFAIRSGAVLLAYQTSIALLFLRRILHKNQSVTSDAIATKAGVPGGGMRLSAHRHVSYQQPYTSQHHGAFGARSKAVEMAHVTQASSARHTGATGGGGGGGHDGSTPGGGGGGGTNGGGRAATTRGSTPGTVGTGTGTTPGEEDLLQQFPRRRSLQLDHLALSDVSLRDQGGVLLGTSPADAAAAAAALSSSASGAVECSQSLANSLLLLSTPRFHLPPRAEYETWSQPELVCLVDDAADNIASLQSMLDEAREAQEQRMMRHRKKHAIRALMQQHQQQLQRTLSPAQPHQTHPQRSDGSGGDGVSPAPVPGSADPLMQGVSPETASPIEEEQEPNPLSVLGAERSLDDDEDDNMQPHSHLRDELAESLQDRV